jgi:hypothetical protein
MFGRLWSSYGSGPPTQGGLICASAFSEVQFVFYGHDKTSSRVLSFFHGVFFAGSVVPCRRSTPGKCNRHESYVAPHACRCTSMHVGETILKSDAGHVVPRPHRLAGVAQSAHGTQHPARNNLPPVATKGAPPCPGANIGPEKLQKSGCRPCLPSPARRFPFWGAAQRPPPLNLVIRIGNNWR